MNEMDEIREKIRETDEQIFELIGRRLRLAREIGDVKRVLRAPLRDYTVEAQVIDRAERLCQRMGIERQTGRAIAKELIRASIFVQSSAIPPLDGNRKRILIVGGLGKMGKWYSHFFNVQGHEVVINDVRKEDSPFRVESDLRSAASQADVVILTTPISSTAPLLSVVAEAAPDALIMDGCSLKTPLIPELRRLASSGRKVTSIHPMFGPDTVMLADQNLIVCDCGNASAVQEAIDLFRDTSVSIVRMDIERHDELMSYVLGATHALNIIMFRTLIRGGIPAEELLRCASTSFRKQMRTTVDVARENPLLYYEIQHLNRYRDRMFKYIHESLTELQSAAISEDSNKFLELMKSGSEYFGGVSVE